MGGYMHTACVGSLHTLAPSACHMHPWQGMGVSCLLFLSPLGEEGERKGAAVLRCQLSLVLSYDKDQSTQETESFSHKSTLC